MGKRVRSLLGRMASRFVGEEKKPERTGPDVTFLLTIERRGLIGTLAGDAARDLYTSIENLTGSNHGDRLVGDNGRNVLRGLYGEDTLIGGGGVDRLEGGASDDHLDGGWGWDYAIYGGNRGAYAVSTAGAVTTVSRIGGGGDGTDTLVNIEVIQFADGLIYL